MRIEPMVFALMLPVNGPRSLSTRSDGAVMPPGLPVLFQEFTLSDVIGAVETSVQSVTFPSDSTLGVEPPMVMLVSLSAIFLTRARRRAS